MKPIYNHGKGRPPMKIHVAMMYEYSLDDQNLAYFVQYILQCMKGNAKYVTMFLMHTCDTWGVGGMCSQC